MFPRLSEHRKVLLLPDDQASTPLEEALRPLGIEVHRYRLSRMPAIEVHFSAAFLRLCGLSPEGAARTGAF